MATSGKLEEIKGRIEEAIGVLTGDGRQKRRGKIDQAAGKTKRRTEKMIDEVKNSAQRMSKRAR